MTIGGDKLVLPLASDNYVQNIKESKSGEILSASFEVKNTSNTNIKLEIENTENSLKIKEENSELMPNQKSIIRVLFDTKNLTGHQSKSFKVKAAGYEGEITLFINTELK